MAYQRPTLTEIVSQIQSDIETRLTSGANLLRRSILRVLARAYSGAVHLLYGAIEYNKDQQFATTADEEHLLIHGSEFGIPRNAATKSTGTVLATGTDGVVIPALSELESATGQIYLTDAIYTPSGGQIAMSITAKGAGADWNEDVGAVLSFTSPIPGINTTVTVTVELSGGADEEDLELYRQRVLNRKRQPPHGGAEFDYVTWMKEVSGVTRAWCIPLYQGIGTIGLAFVRDNDNDLIPSESEISTVRSYIISHSDPITGKTVGVPVTAEAGLYMIRLNKLSTSPTIELYPNTSENQVLVTNLVEQVILLRGGPEQAIYASEISEAVLSVSGVLRHRVTWPSGLDYLTASSNQIHVPGTISYLTYNG